MCVSLCTCPLCRTALKLGLSCPFSEPGLGLQRWLLAVSLSLKDPSFLQGWGIPESGPAAFNPSLFLQGL